MEVKISIENILGDIASNIGGGEKRVSIKILMPPHPHPPPDGEVDPSDVMGGIPSFGVVTADHTN